MKSSLLAVSLSFLLFAFLTKPLLGHPDPLLDSDGDPVKAGSAYYIGSAIRGAGGGGLSIAGNRNGLCPFDIIQFPLDTQRGDPMFLYPTNYSSENRGYVHEAWDVNIMVYTRMINCHLSLVWQVDDYDHKRGAWFVTTNGAIGNPGPHTLKSWFRFVKADVGNSYKIVHCPSVSESSVHLCSDVGIEYAENARRLALRTQPLRVVLVKAHVIPA